MAVSPRLLQWIIVTPSAVDMTHHLQWRKASCGYAVWPLFSICSLELFPRRTKWLTLACSSKWQKFGQILLTYFVFLVFEFCIYRMNLEGRGRRVGCQGIGPDFLGRIVINSGHEPSNELCKYQEIKFFKF